MTSSQRAQNLILFATVYIAIQLGFAWFGNEPIELPGLLVGTLIATVIYGVLTWALELFKKR